MKKKLFGLAATAGLLVASAVAVGAPAQAQTQTPVQTQAIAGGCTTGAPGIWSVYNSNCTWARHFDVVNGSRIYASKVGPKSTSAQGVCWAGVTSWGVDKSNVATGVS